MLTGAEHRRIAWPFIAPGNPMLKRIREASNGRMRDELLNEKTLYDLDHASAALARWKPGTISNACARHLAISAPAAFAQSFHRNGRRLCKPPQLRRWPVAPPTLWRQSQSRTLIRPQRMNVGDP